MACEAKIAFVNCDLSTSIRRVSEVLCLFQRKKIKEL